MRESGMESRTTSLNATAAKRDPQKDLWEQVCMHASSEHALALLFSSLLDMRDSGLEQGATSLDATAAKWALQGDSWGKVCTHAS